MPKNRSRRDNNLRSHIAYLAARMMAEDGIADFGTAKAKAARQAGLADANLLPDNHEIEAALREYQGLYQQDEQPEHLRYLREVAVKAMREFEQFRPVLVGSVLSGTAGQYSDVNLQLYADDVKSLQIFLLNRRYRFEDGLRRMRLGDRMVEVPQIRVEMDDVAVSLTVLDRDDERLRARGRDEDEPLWARLPEVEALLAASPPP